MWVFDTMNPDGTPTWQERVGLANLSRRDKLLLILTGIAILYAIFKQPDVKVTVVKEKVVNDDKKGSSHAAAKEAFNLKGLAGSTLHVNADGSYDVIGPFELSASKSSESSSEWHDTHKEVDKEKTITEPAQAWRLAVRASALTPIDHLDLKDVSWTVGGTAHVGQLKIFALRFDIGVGGEVWRSVLTQRTLVGPNVLVTF